MNSIMIIYPYKYHGSWVFDDKNTGLVREPFVCGSGEIIDELVKVIESAHDGFSLLFSENIFPEFDMSVEWMGEEYGGNWYYCENLGMKGWLCPALFKYFEKAPTKIYLKAEKGIIK